MRDPFEESLRDMLNAQSSRDDNACLSRVLKTANRQVGAGDLFGLMGNWLQAVLIAASGSAGRAPAVTRRSSSRTTFNDKAD
ncbi:CrfX protein [Stutzerimonas stutzeri]|uniref:CrfX protein n=1 Tax=Stutzerimonas stutzeri TaxID=316 RepID=UPI001C2DFB5E|nr:CrfX protein [Stutzerimonas stutzeri]